jgi:hypothetical protein
MMRLIILQLQKTKHLTKNKNCKNIERFYYKNLV